MEIKKITDTNICEIKDKNIIIYVKATECISQMDSKYGIANQITAIIEDFEHRRKACQINGKMVEAYDSSYLYNVDWTETALVILSDYYWEIFNKLNADELLTSKLDVVYRFSSGDTNMYEYYYDKYSDFPLELSMVFRCGPKSEVKDKLWEYTDNTRAIFEYLVKEKYDRKYNLYFFVNNPEWVKAHNNYISENVVLIDEAWAKSTSAEEQEQYYRALCLSKYIFFDHEDTFARIARKEQIKVQLWHGQGFKGRAISTSMKTRCTYMPVMSELYASIHKKIFDLEQNQMVITGIPKQDWVFNKVKEETIDILKIPKADKYLFWLPTWRKVKWTDDIEIGIQNAECETNLPIFNKVSQLKDLNETLRKNNVCMLIKGHPEQRIMIGDNQFSNIILVDCDLMADYHIHINELLNMADGLISDYSSVITDYLLLNRPICLAIDDVKEYQESRGFVFEPICEWLPGKIAITKEEMIEFVEEIGRGIDSSKEKREKIAQKICEFHDANNCRRLVEVLDI